MFCPKCGVQQAEGAYYCKNCGKLLPQSGTAPAGSQQTGASALTWVEYAGFWRRFAASILDGILVNIVAFIIGLISGAGGTYLIEGELSFASLFVWVAGVLYYTICESSPMQATLGKLALGIKVTDMEGRRISFGRALGRYFGKILSGLILCIGYIMIAFTERRQGLHDMMAGTLVVVK